MDSSSSSRARTRAEISRSVADREASRLARPERRGPIGPLAHASKSKSAVTSTPSGVNAVRALTANGAAEEEWSGPFSVARQMIAAREAARAKREAELERRGNTGGEHPLDEIVEQVELERKRKLNPSMRWKSNIHNDDNDNEKDISGSSKRENLYAKRRKRVERLKTGGGQNVPPLFHLCVDFLVQNFEFVESLGNRVDSIIRKKICEGLVAAGKLGNEAFDALAETGVEALEIVDCSSITQDQLSETLKRLIPEGLEALLLNHAGRCFGPQAVQAIVESFKAKEIDGRSNVPSLCAIAIGGAYLLTDSDAGVLIKETCHSISSIEFRACPLLGEKFCNTIAHCYASSMTSAPLLELSLEAINLSKEDLKVLASSDALRNVRSIKLLHIEQLDDECAEMILASAGESLEGINLSHNVLLTDDILSCIRRCNVAGALRSLQLAGLKELTSFGLEAFFTRDIEGLPQPPALRMLDLSQCAEDAVTDHVLELAVLSSSTKRDSSELTTTNASHAGHSPLPRAKSSSGGLYHLNISGAGTVTDKSMEHLAEYCATSLRELNVSYCPKISDKGLGYLVSEVGDQFQKLSIWGMAQLTDEFHDGHCRSGDPRFQVVGAWMKKSTLN